MTNLAKDAALALDYLAKEANITKEEALRRAIATEAYFYTERKTGSVILIKKPNGELREVLFR